LVRAEDPPEYLIHMPGMVSEIEKALDFLKREEFAHFAVGLEKSGKISLA
jgi:hypothetical protein